MGVNSLETNVIMNELNELEKMEKTDDELVRDEQRKEFAFELPEPAKHFLIFIVTTWSPTSQDGKRSCHQFVCARFGLTTIDSTFLKATIRKIILYLSFYGFIVIMIGGDGASENRSCFKSLANKTARDILKGHYPDDLLEQLNLDFKIAFAHPNPEYAEAIVIFIGADMPHWVKKVRNAMDNKQTRDLSFNGRGLMLERLYGIHRRNE